LDGVTANVAEVGDAFDVDKGWGGEVVLVFVHHCGYLCGCLFFVTKGKLSCSDRVAEMSQKLCVIFLSARGWMKIDSEDNQPASQPAFSD